MRQTMSVFALAARATFYKIILVLILMSAAEIAVFQFFLNHSDGLGLLEESIDRSLIILIWMVTLGVICFLLENFAYNTYGSNPGYTISRLSISEKRFAAICSVYNICCLILLFAVQILTAFILCSLYVRQNTENPYSPAIFLAFCRNRFLHDLLPLGSIFGLIKVIVIITGLGLSCACTSLFQRHGHNYNFAVCLIACVIASFVGNRIGVGFDMAFVIALGGIAISSFFMVKGVDTDET